MGGPVEVAMQRAHRGSVDKGEAGEQHKRSSLRERAKSTVSKLLSHSKSPNKVPKDNSGSSSGRSSQAPVPNGRPSNDDDFGPRPGSHQQHNNDSSRSGSRSGSSSHHDKNPSVGNPGDGNQYLHNSATNEFHSGEEHHDHREPSDYPDEFKCPILNKLMAEPVIVASGISYERLVIQLYFQRGHRQCYKTRVILESDAVVKNTSLKSAIDNWCDSHGVSRPVPPSPEAARNAVEGIGVREDSSASDSFGPDNVSSAGSTGEWSRPHSGVLQQIHENGPLSSSGRREDGGSTPRRMFEPPNRQFQPLSHTWSEPNSKHSMDHQEGSSSRPTYGSHNPFGAEHQPAALSSVNYHHTATYSTPPRRSIADVEHSRSSVPLPLTQTPASFSAETKGSVSPDGSLEDDVVDALVSKLKHKHVKEQDEAAAELRHLTRISAHHRLELCEMYVVEPLLKLLQSRYAQMQINSAAAIMNLSLEKDNKLKIARFGAIPYLIDVLQSGVPEAQEHAAGAIFSLALNDENKMAIGVLGAIPPLIHLLRSDQQGARRDAAMALYHLSFSQMNRSKLIKAGGVGTFLGIVRDERSDVVSRALLILCNIAAIQDGRAALAEKDATPILVSLLTKGDGETSEAAENQDQKVNWADVREHAAATLLLLSQHNFRFRTQALQAGAVEGLQLLELEGTPRAREKAAALLAILRESPSGQDGGLDNHAAIYPRRAFARPGVDVSKAESSVF